MHVQHYIYPDNGIIANLLQTLPILCLIYLTVPQAIQLFHSKTTYNIFQNLNIINSVSIQSRILSVEHYSHSILNESFSKLKDILFHY